MIVLISTFDYRHVHLLEEFIAHYRSLGVDLFRISLHFPVVVEPTLRESTILEVNRILEIYDVKLNDIFSFDYNSYELRARHDLIQSEYEHGNNWLLWADADEFQQYPDCIRKYIVHLDRSERHFAGGVLIDRVSREINDYTSVSKNIWQSYPLGICLTGMILNGTTHKTVLARSNIRISIGNHFTLSRDNTEISHKREHLDIPVHHFKWDPNVVDRLKDRLRDAFKSACYWWPESERALQYVLGSNSISSDMIYDFKDDLFDEDLWHKYSRKEYKDIAHSRPYIFWKC